MTMLTKIIIVCGSVLFAALAVQSVRAEWYKGDVEDLRAELIEAQKQTETLKVERDQALAEIQKQNQDLELWRVDRDNSYADYESQIKTLQAQASQKKEQVRTEYLRDPSCANALNLTDITLQEAWK